MLDLEFQKLIDDYLEKEGVVNKTFSIKIREGQNFDIRELRDLILGNVLEKGIYEELKEIFYESSYNEFIKLKKRNVSEEVIEKFKEWELPVNFKLEREIFEYIDKEYKVQDVFDELLENTKLESLCLHIGKSEKAYLMKKGFFESYEEATHNSVKKEIIQDSGINWLIQSQGYEFKDLWNDEMLNKSNFLKTVKEEFVTPKNNKSSLQLAIYIGDVTLKKVLDIRKNNLNIYISKEAICGLFGVHHHDASLLNIKLEKDIILPPDKVEHTSYKYWFNDNPYRIFPCAYNRVYGKNKLKNLELVTTNEAERFTEEKIILSKMERFHKLSGTGIYKKDKNVIER